MIIFKKIEKLSLALLKSHSQSERLNPNVADICCTFRFENLCSPKKSFIPKKIIKKLIFFYFIVLLFSANAIVYSNKFSKKKLTESMKKTPSKVVQNQPPTFFMYWSGCPHGTETKIRNHQNPLNAGLGT